MANTFPGSLNNYPTGSNSLTLANMGHVSAHNAYEAKIGIGSSTPVANTVLRGTGTGTSSWAQVNLTTDVTGVLPGANGGTGVVTLTQPATAATLTIANNKTLTASNTVTLAGTDGTTITFQGTDTYVGRTTTDTLTNKTLTSPKINVGSDAQGDIYYRDGSGNFARLAPGTSGNILQTNGAGANPSWSTGVAGAITTAKRQDVSTNTTLSNVILQTGWNFIHSLNGTSVLQKTITFPIAFNTVPIVTVSSVGDYNTGGGADPTAITQFTTAQMQAMGVRSISTTVFIFNVQDTSSLGVNDCIGFAWTAIGT